MPHRSSSGSSESDGSDGTGSMPRRTKNRGSARDIGPTEESRQVESRSWRSWLQSRRGCRIGVRRQQHQQAELLGARGAGRPRAAIADVGRDLSSWKQSRSGVR
jgi:hypothetical protein